MFLNTGNSFFRLILGKPSNTITILSVEGENTDITFSDDTYYLMSIDKVGSKITVNFETTNGESIASVTKTLPSTFQNTEVKYGFSFGYSSHAQFSYKNVKIQAI